MMRPLAEMSIRLRCAQKLRNSVRNSSKISELTPLDKSIDKVLPQDLKFTNIPRSKYNPRDVYSKLIPLRYQIPLNNLISLLGKWRHPNIFTIEVVVPLLSSQQASQVYRTNAKKHDYSLDWY
ncbi:hypothetical protein CDAR_476241 [Caerostris darwini]|uniref:Uncharacterized protein n=1 Tax=Caerostris darwini TaxID=1538125 RepID=A0AAV4P4U7_9ARAC|nr:hypothetical protein CDAR_476241 [Caerostris darwini]